MLFSGYFFISSQQTNLSIKIENNKNTFMTNKKAMLKREVDVIIELIEFKRSQKKQTEDELKKDIYEWIRHVRYGEKEHNYIFVYELGDDKNSEKFIKMLINPNRPDLEGNYVSNDYTDENGKAFRKMFLQDIHAKGDSFVEYMYKKPESTIVRPKISYFKLYKEWGLVIAAGAYIDDIDKEAEATKRIFQERMKTEVISAIYVFLLVGLLASTFAVILGKQIERFLNNYRTKVEQKTMELKELNRTLESRVKDEIQKNREKEQLLIQKSKFIALGEMISNIAHQWRQPLSQLSALFLTIKYKQLMGNLDNDELQEKHAEVENVIEYMSNTIDDFRNFFMPNKDAKEFSIKSSVDDVLRIIGISLKNYGIEIKVSIDEDAVISGYKNEYEQVLLNILSNAKDAILSNGIKDGQINISLKNNENNAQLIISDNGGGILVEPIEKIFEPYASTKEQANGTGIGLYMAKMIIEKNMGGKLEARNGKDGAIFLVEIKKGFKEALGGVPL